MADTITPVEPQQPDSQEVLAQSGTDLVVVSLTDAKKDEKDEKTEENEEDKPNRQRWNNRIQFLFTCIGYAVGIGNIWRFPYLAYRFGGGAFLIPYLLSLAVLGVPLFILELSIGKHFQMSVVKLYTTFHYRFRGVGFATVLTTFLVGAYYSILLAWSLLFLVRCFANEVPWGSDPATFFYKDILNSSPSINEIGSLNGWLVLTLFASIFLVFLSVRHGVSSSGRASIVLVTIPYIFLIVLFFRAVTLPGAEIGIAYYLYPDWNKMLDMDIWVQAASQIFFSLGPGFGMIVAFGSFLPQKEDVVKDSLIIALTNSATSVFAGFVVFGVLGHFSLIQHVPVDKVATAGPELAFIVYPESLSLLPGSVFFSIAFFTMLFFLGASSEVAWNVALISIIHEELKSLAPHYESLKKLKKTHVTIVVLSLAFVSSLVFTSQAGLHLMNLFDHYVPQFILMIIALLECVAVGWVYGGDRLIDEMCEKTGVRIGKKWSIMWRYVVPLVLLVLLIFEFIQEFTHPFLGFPSWAIGLGWAFSFICAIPIIPYIFGCIKGAIHLDDSKGRAHAELTEGIEMENVQ